MRQKKGQKLQCNGRQPKRTTGATEEKSRADGKRCRLSFGRCRAGKRTVAERNQKLWRGTEKSRGGTCSEREACKGRRTEKKAEQLQVEQLLHEQEKRWQKPRHKRAVQEKFSVRFSGKWRKMKRENLTL